LGDKFDLSGSRGVMGHMAIRFGIGHFLLVVIWNHVSISNCFRDSLHQTSCAHGHSAELSWRMHNIT